MDSGASLHTRWQRDKRQIITPDDTETSSVTELAWWATLPSTHLWTNPFQSYIFSWKGWSRLVEKVDKWLCFPTRSSNQALKMIRDMLIIFANLWLSIFNLHVRTIQCPTRQAGMGAAGSERVPPMFACLKRSRQCGLRKLTATCITAMGQEVCFQRTNRFPENIPKEEACRKLQAKQAQLSENREAHVKKKEEIIEIVKKGRVQEMECSLICTKWLQPAVMLVSYLKSINFFHRRQCTA